jgi:DNA uptake protein ComE-like DNA-binding protein
MIRSRLLIPLALATAVLLSTPSVSLAQTATNTTSAKAPKSARVDINTASKSELRALAGVDDTTAQKIIDGRPYAKKNQLITKKIVSQTTYDTIKGEIVAKKSKK